MRKAYKQNVCCAAEVLWKDFLLHRSKFLGMLEKASTAFFVNVRNESPCCLPGINDE